MLRNVFLEGIVQNCFKCAKVLAIYQKVMKIFFKDRLVRCFEGFNLFNTFQFGFRSGRSTKEVLRAIVDIIFVSLDNGWDSGRFM